MFVTGKDFRPSALFAGETKGTENCSTLIRSGLWVSSLQNLDWTESMDKLQLTGQNLGRVFKFRSGHVHVDTILVLSIKLPNLKLKTRPKQLIGSLLLVITLPIESDYKAQTL